MKNESDYSKDFDAKIKDSNVPKSALEAAIEPTVDADFGDELRKKADKAMRAISAIIADEAIPVIKHELTKAAEEGKYEASFVALNLWAFVKLPASTRIEKSGYTVPKDSEAKRIIIDSIDAWASKSNIDFKLLKIDRDNKYDFLLEWKNHIG